MRNGERGVKIHRFAIQRWTKFLFISGSFLATWFRLNFLPQLLPEVPAPSSCWSQDDPRSVAAHRGIIAQIVLDFQPLSIVNNKGFIINNRQVYRALTSSQMIDVTQVDHAPTPTSQPKLVSSQNSEGF